MLPYLPSLHEPELESKQVFPSDSWSITADDFQQSEVGDLPILIQDPELITFMLNPATGRFLPHHGLAHIQLPQLSHCQCQQALFILIICVKEQEN